MDPASALLLFTLFQATEKVIGHAGGKVADAVGKPIWEALEGKAHWLAKNDETAKRWQAFAQAFEDAKVRFEAEASNPDIARQVNDVLAIFDLTSPHDREWLNDLVSAPEKISLLSDKPDFSTMAELINAALKRQGQQPPSRADMVDSLAIFVRVFQDRLFAQSAYQQLMLNQAQWQQLHQPRYDSRERYLEQIIRYHLDLDFVGIPELKDRQALHLEDVFIHLQAEIEAEMPLSEEEQRTMRETSDARTFIKLLSKDLMRARAERNQLMHSRNVTQQLSVNEALAKYSRMVILGDPGAGKTTLLKYVTLAFASGHSDKLNLTEARLPIFIRLYDYIAKRAERQTDYSLVDYLYTQAHENLQVSLEIGFFENELERGQCCVCLDGLDELGGAGLRREVVAAVNALVNKYQRNRYLITSRLVGYEEAPLDKREFVHHTVLPFSDDDIQAFVKKWYAAREKDPAAARDRSQHLIDTIKREPRIKTLAANPLMLTIIALVHRIEAELPHERVKLYDKCVTALVQTWEEVKGLRVEDRQRIYYKHRRRLLEQLAYWMHSQPGDPSTGSGGRNAREVKEGDLEFRIRRFLLENPKLSLDDETAHQEAHDFVNLVKGRTGLLIERGEGVYAFPHLTFQEYLAAADIEHRLAHSIDTLWAEIQPRLHDPHWREVILLLLGSLNKFEHHPTELVRRIFESTDRYEDVLHRHLFLAACALADRVEVEIKLHQAIVDQLLGLVNAQEWWIRYDACAALGSLEGNYYAAQSLLALAQDPRVDALVRCDAAQALGGLGRAGEAATILLAFAQDPQLSAWVRREAAKALGGLGRADEAATILLAFAQDQRVDESERRDAAQALGGLGRADEAVLNGLLALAQDPQVGPHVRHEAAQAIGGLGRADEAVLNGLLALTQVPRVDVWVRREAAQALGRLGRADEAVLNGLLALAKDPRMDVWVRSEAAQALGSLGRADEAATILLALAQDQDPWVIDWVRRDAARALGRLGRADEAVLNGLLALAHDPWGNVGVRCDAAQALGGLGRADEAATILLALAQDPQVDTHVRRDAAQALGGLGRADEAATILLALAQDPQVDTHVRRDAARALGGLGRADEAVPILLALAHDRKADEYVRRDAAQALGRLGRADEAVPILLALAHDRRADARVRRDAVQSLGQLGPTDEAVLNSLLALAQNPQVDSYVRSAAYGSLKALLGGEASA